MPAGAGPGLGHTPLPGEPGPASAPVCPAPRILCATRTQSKQVLLPQVITVDVPSLYPLCLRVANCENVGPDEFTVPSRLAVSGWKPFVVVCGEGPTAQLESEGSVTGDDVIKTGTDESRS